MNQSQKRVMPAQHDILGETLYALRLKGVIYSKSELTAPWGIDMPPLDGKMMFHIITKGGGWLRLPDQQDVYLNPVILRCCPEAKGTLLLMIKPLSVNLSLICLSPIFQNAMK